MKDSGYSGLEPGSEITYAIPASAYQQTQVWYVPVEPRMRVTRAGEPRPDWKLWRQTGLAMACVALVMALLLHWPASRSLSHTTMPPPAVSVPAALPVPVPSAFLHRTPAPYASHAAGRTRGYIVPPAVPTAP